MNRTATVPLEQRQNYWKRFKESAVMRRAHTARNLLPLAG
jgi:hypothetical protein